MSAAIRDALAALAAEDFRMGPAWEAAHELAQAHEGEPLYDRLHALAHRIEGDASNARYWYRQAGAAPSSGSFAEEAEKLAADLDAP